MCGTFFHFHTNACTLEDGGSIGQCIRSLVVFLNTTPNPKKRKRNPKKGLGKDKPTTQTPQPPLPSPQNGKRKSPPPSLPISSPPQKCLHPSHLLPPPPPPSSLSPPQKSKPLNPKIPLRGLKSLLRGDGFNCIFCLFFKIK